MCGRRYRMNKYTVEDTPYHGEGMSLWYVVDDDGDPVDSGRTREEAERKCDDMNARSMEVPD